MSNARYDLFLSRVLRCFDNHKFRHEVLTCKEVTERYNELYPPSFMDAVLKRTTTEEKVQSALSVHVRAGFLATDMLSFTDRPLSVPLRRYVLTSLGVQKLHRGEGKKKR